ncbi:MAG: hypothetical protein QNJ19_06930 [Woeseiaceae bacterium]|nr:hypothetical protein [Woeseiaceae bacterium]
MFKRIGIGLAVIVIVVAMFTFTARNRGYVEIDLAYAMVNPSIPVAFTVTFVLGWLFGVICMGLYALKLVNERRGLRRSLRDTESEVSSLRSLPLSDAD